MFGLSDSLSVNRKRHFTFWIKFGPMFGLSERLSERLIQKVKSPSVPAANAVGNEERRRRARRRLATVDRLLRVCSRLEDGLCLSVCRPDASREESFVCWLGARWLADKYCMTRCAWGRHRRFVPGISTRL